MKYRRRIYYSAEQRAEIWDRWQRGESMRSIGRVFDRQSWHNNLEARSAFRLSVKIGERATKLPEMHRARSIL